MNIAKRSAIHFFVQFTDFVVSILFYTPFWPTERPSHLVPLKWRHNWARWRPKLWASPLFTQPFIQAQTKENINAPRHWHLCRGIHRSPVNSPRKWPGTRKMFPFDDVIMQIWPAEVPTDIKSTFFLSFCRFVQMIQTNVHSFFCIDFLLLLKMSYS